MGWATDVSLSAVLLLLIVVAVLVQRLRAFDKETKDVFFCAGPAPANGDMICPLLRQGRRTATDAPGTHPVVGRMIAVVGKTGTQNEAMVLQVEDDALTRSVTSAILRTFDRCRSVDAADGPVGLLLFARLHPDVVLFDWHITGLEGTAWLRAKTEIEHAAKWAPVPIVVLTGDESVRAEAAMWGLDPALVLTKPIERTALEIALRRALVPVARSHPDEGHADPPVDP